MNSFKAHEDKINSIKQSLFNNELVATCSNDLTVKIWNMTTSCWNTNWTLIRTYSNHANLVYGLEWLTEDTIASGGYDNTTQIWSIKTGEILMTIKIYSGVRSLKLLGNGFHLACGLGNGKIIIYDIKNNGSLISTLQGHASYVNDIVQINYGLLASSSFDHSILIWNLTTNSTKFNLTGHASPVFGLKLISSDVLASGSWDKTVKLWNITNGQLIRNILDHKGYIYWSLDVLSDSQILVSGSADQTIKMWNISSGECLNTFNTSLKIRSLTILKQSFETTSKNI
jgi:WD40 repeat protein